MIKKIKLKKKFKLLNILVSIGIIGNISYSEITPQNIFQETTNLNQNYQNYGNQQNSNYNQVQLQNSGSRTIFADYKIHFGKVYLTNYVATMYDNFKLEVVDNNTQAIVDTGQFSIHESGGRQVNVYLENGNINGQYVEYYNNGNIFTRGNYVNGKKEGQWEIYTEAGKLWKTYEYKNDLLNGKYVEYDSNRGVILEEGTYTNDLQDGTWIEYYSTGNRKTDGIYVNGKKNGQFTEWYTNGRKKSLLNYIEDELNGKIAAYYDTGELLYEGEVLGRTGFIKGYNKYGKVGYEGKIENNRKVGKWSYYDDYGNLYNEVNYQETGYNDGNYNGTSYGNTNTTTSNNDLIYSEPSYNGTIIEGNGY